MLPLLLLALRLPPTVLVPRFKGPELFSVRFPLLETVPSVSALTSVMLTAAPVADTAPVKSFAALVSVMLPVPAFRLLVPVTVSTPV